MFSAENAVLVIVDVQGKLAHLVHEKEGLFRHIQGLIKAIRYLDVPILWTEQAPHKIGKTIPEIAGQLDGYNPIEKVSFSCCGHDEFVAQLKTLNRKQVIVAGIETHVCVYQTISDLVKLQYEVQVVGDAVSSRTLENKHLALARIKALGAVVTSTEMIICELLKTSEHERFKEIMALMKSF